MKSKAYQTAEKMLAKADIKINGTRPWDIQVHNDKLFERIFSGGTLAIGESYMDKWWDVEKLDEFIFHAVSAQLDSEISWASLWSVITARLYNRQNKKRSKEVAEEHYDVGNDLYTHMLGKYMQYTCAYWKGVDNLDAAQEQKLDLICKKLKLKPGETVLELGCGFGGFAKFAAERYGVKVTAYNISKEQIKFGRDWNKGLPVEIVESDYRNATGTFDKVAAIGIAEHVGYKNYRAFMELGYRCLKPGGLFIVHTIATDKAVFRSEDPWFDKYIFPGGMLPSPKQFGAAIDGLFVLEDWHNFGSDYDKTLRAWHENFVAHWPELKGAYSERFYRMWEYYLLSFAGMFRARKMQLWQLVLAKGGYPGGYESVR